MGARPVMSIMSAAGRRLRGAMIWTCFHVMVGLALISPAAAEGLHVEDWSEQAVGAKGVPLGWTKYETIGGRPA